jgi:hypothetical protein
MPFGFDPRKLIDEDKKNKKEEEKQAWYEREELDKAEEEHENSLRRKSNIKNAFDSAFQTLREFKYLKKHGKEKYHEAKKLQDSDYEPQSFREWAKENKGILQGTTMDWKTGDTIWPEELNENQKRLLSKKYKTVGQEYGETDDTEDKYSNQIVLASTQSQPEDLKPTVKWESSGRASDPFENEVGISESILGALVSGGIKIPYGWANLSAMLMDWADKENVPFDQSRVAKLERWFDNTMFGTAMAWGEDRS